MLHAWQYHVEVRPEPGSNFHAYAPALPEAIASGATEEEALEAMREIAAAAVRSLIKFGLPLTPPPALPPEASGYVVRLPAGLAIKAALYSAWKASGLSKAAFGERLGRGEKEARRLLDPDHASRLDHMDQAAVALGIELIVASLPVQAAG